MLLPVRALAQILPQGYTPVEHAPAGDLLGLAGWAAGGGALACGGSGGSDLGGAGPARSAMKRAGRL